MTGEEAREIMKRASDRGAPLPNIVEYSEALRKTREVLGSDYTEEQLQNWILVGKYPFLIPRYDWSGEIIEDYPLDENNAHEASYPSCLILRMLVHTHDAIHVVVGFNGRRIIIISAYYPDLEHWESDYKTRKENC